MNGVLLRTGEAIAKLPVQTDGSVRGQRPILADVDADGDLEIFAYRADLKKILGFDHEGNRLPFFPLQDDLLPGVSAVNGYGITIADVDGDDLPELIYGGDYQRDSGQDDSPYSFKVIARDLNGLMVPGFPVTFEGKDGDPLPTYRIYVDTLGGGEFGTNAHVVATIGSELHILDTGHPFSKNQQHWPAK